MPQQPNLTGVHTFDENRASISWSITRDDIVANPGRYIIGPCTVPGVSRNGLTDSSWYRFDLSALSTQKNRVFGNIRAIQLCISRIWALTTNAANFQTPGRTVVYNPETGQTFIFSAKSYAQVTNIGIVPNGNPIAPMETTNVVFPLFGQANADIQLWIENDIVPTPATETFNTSIIVSLFNFEQPLVAL
jgi:hypothetical protein